MAVKRRKLYINVVMTAGQTSALFQPTELTIGTTTPADRWGGFLQDLPALTGGSPAAIKEKNDVMGYFQPASFVGSVAGDDATVAGLVPCLDYVNAAGAVTALAFLSAGGTIVATKAGHTPIFTRHFRVRLRKTAGATVIGVLTLERQHSIEV